MKTKLSILCGMSLALALATSGRSAESTTANPEPSLKVAHIQGMDVLPRIVSKVAPVYPTELRARGVQGVAVVEMVVDSTGRVVDVQAVRSTTPEFAVQAIAAAKGWTFQPAEASGQKITSRVQIPFEFVMPQVAALD